MRLFPINICKKKPEFFYLDLFLKVETWGTGPRAPPSHPRRKSKDALPRGRPSGARGSISAFAVNRGSRLGKVAGHWPT